MSTIKHSVVDGSFPLAEHRVTLVQVGVSLSSADGLAPYAMSPSPQHVDKVTKALSSALRDNWTNIAVFPEHSIPAQSLTELASKSWELVKARPKDAGAAIVWLPLEHLSLVTFKHLVDDFSKCSFLRPGDSSLTTGGARDLPLIQLPRTDREHAFANVAVILLFPQSGSSEQGLYYFQPKRFPYPGENDPLRGRLVPGLYNYLIEIGDTKILTAICYDMIAQMPGAGLVLSRLTGECFENFGGLDYLIVPQCNEKPLDSNFQRALCQIYLDHQPESQTLRTISSNVAHIIVTNKRRECGHSWIVTSLHSKELPLLGIRERILPSVFIASSGEVCREAPSLGNYAQRLRLSAAGEWMLHLTLPNAQWLLRGKGPNISLSAHRGTIYQWANGIWQEKDQSAFERDCRHSEQLPGLNVLTDLPEWIKENLGGASSYSPSFDEFKDGSLQLPCAEKEECLSMLKEFRDVWVRGAPASGKTVFGLGVALDWMKQSNSRTLFCDLKDIDSDSSEFIKEAKDDIDWFLSSGQKSFLIVLDNIHTRETEATALLRYVHDLRQLGHQVQALVLGRWKESQSTERRSLADISDVATIDLIIHEEVFACAARRLLKRTTHDYEVSSHIASKWLSECGGDLVVFAVSFDPLNPESLDQQSIATQVRKRYITRAEMQGGRDSFITLCALSSIDVDMEGQTVWSASVESLFPDFVEDGTVLRVIKGPRNPRQYCRLFHSSLGEVVLKVHTNFSRPRFERMWLKHTTDACRCHPFLFSLIHRRLSMGGYRNIVSLEKWNAAIGRCDGLVERAICSSPYFTAIALHRGDLEWSWERLINLPTDEGYDNLFTNLIWTPAHFVVTFLNYLDAHSLTKQRETLLNELLDSDDFKTSVARTPAGDIVTFLNYLDAHSLTKQREALLNELLDSDDFKTSVARTPAGHIVTYLNYLDDHDLTEQRGALLSELLKSSDFTESLFHSSLDGQGHFLEYVSTAHDKDMAQGLLSAHWGSLSPVDFENRVSVWSRHMITGFRASIRKGRLTLPSDLWELLTRLAVGPTYRVVVPDPEYPQNLLLAMPVVEFTGLLRRFASTRNRYKMNCILASLFSNEENVEVWINRLSHEDVVLFRETVRELRSKVPSLIYELLVSRYENGGSAGDLDT